MPKSIDINDIIKGVPELTKDIKQLNTEVDKLANTLIGNQSKYNKTSKSQKDLTDKTKDLTEAEKELEKIRKRSDKVTLDTVRAAEDLRNKRKSLTEQVRAENGETKKNISFTDRLTKSFKTAALQVTAFIGAVAGVVKGFIALNKYILETNKQTSKTAAQFGVTRDEAKGLAGEIRAMSAAFGKDFNDVLKSANILSKEFGITGEQALSLINEGFEKGADINGEFLELLKEYPAQLRTVGLDARETIAIITQTERAGVFSDKGIDAIKEAGIRLREMTPATLAALNGIGLSGEEIQKQLETGEKSLFEVTQDVSQRLSELPPQSKEVGTAIADIFGGPGEDVGLRFLTTLKDIDTNLDNVASTLSEAEIAQNELSKAWENFKTSLSDTDGIISRVFTFFKNELTDVIKKLTILSKGIEGAVIEDAIDLWDRYTDKLKEKKNLDEVLISLQESRIKISSKLEGANKRETKAINANLIAIDAAIEKVKQEQKAIVDAENAKVKIQDAANKKIIKDKENTTEKLIEIETKYLGTIKLSQKQYAAFLEGENDKRLEDSLELWQKSIEEVDLWVEEQINSEQNVTDEIKAQLEERLKARLEADAKELENLRQTEEAKKELRAETEEAITTIITDQINFRIDENLSRFQAEQEAKEQILKDQLDKGIIDEEEYEIEIKKLKRKSLIEESKADKKKALFDIAINTAAAVVKALPNLILSGLALVIGGVQAAAVAARPIPAFRHGGIMSKDGLARMSEDGSELAILPDGHKILTPEKETIGFIPKNTKIFPAQSKETRQAKEQNYTRYDELIKETKLTRKAILNQPKQITQITDRGMKKIVSNGLSSKIYIDKYMRGI